MAYSLRRKFSCHVELSLEVLGGKWKPVILGHLKQGALRYSELRTLIPALSDKMLAQRLADLVELGLIARDKRGGRGSRSQYALTPRGATLRQVLQALNDWGELIAHDVGAVVQPIVLQVRR